MGILCLVQQVADQIGKFLLRLSFNEAAGSISYILHVTLNPEFPPNPCLQYHVYSKFQIFELNLYTLGRACGSHEIELPHYKIDHFVKMRQLFSQVIISALSLKLINSLIFN